MAAIDTLRLDMPAEWLEIPTSPGEVEPFLRERAATDEWERLSRTDRRTFESFVRRLVNELEAQRCELAAVYAEPMEDGAEDGGDDSADGGEPPEVTLLMAAVMVARVSRAEMGSVLSLTPDVLLAAMSLPVPDSPSRDLDPPEIVELAVGRTVRTCRLQRLGDTGADMFVEQYFVPVEPDHEELFLLQFTTPNLEEAPLFSELFRAIADTFALYREGDPTPA